MRDAGEFRSGFIGIVGVPNVGKSTFLNRILETKAAITSPKPQTTRSRIVGVKDLPNAQLVFVDTPGIHCATTTVLNRQMVATALRTLREVDVLLVMTAVVGVRERDEAILFEKLSEVKPPVFLLINKIDLVPKPNLLPLIDRYQHRHGFDEIIPISALKGTNVQLVLNTVEARLEPGPRYFPEGTVSDTPEEMYIAELIREKVLRYTHQEVPYAAAVVVEGIEETSKGDLSIDGTIYVQKQSQKGIIIGRQGRMLQQIGRSARLEIEHILGCRVHLRLWVKVRKDWTTREDVLREFGYAES